MYMANGGATTDQSTERERVLEQVELEFQEDEPEINDHEQEEPVTTEQEGLRHYQLTRVRSRRQIRVPARYAQAGTVSFAFHVA